jgi:superfamily II DNA or RNA helicase
MARQNPLFAQDNPRTVIPQAVRADHLVGKTKVFQTYFEGYDGPCEERRVSDGGTEWTETTLPSGFLVRIVDRGATAPLQGPFLRDTATGRRWENVRGGFSPERSRIEALQSWDGAFTFREENRETQILGLRTPQIGALHAIHAHWTVSDEPAMIVMPTGTGKTETMLSTLVSQRCNRVLVIVPSLILRDQIFGKFTTLGLLKKLGVLAPLAHLPVVGLMRGSIDTPEEVDQAFGPCNVVVAVINSVARCPEPALQRLAELCTHLFIDEAHHVPAATWSRVKGIFLHKRVLQFTATPYRNDGKRVDGKLIYAFPLRKAQEQGYFKPIRYLPVVEFLPERSDRAIAMAAVARLREDIKNDQFDHILMARGHPIDRLEQKLEPLYQELASDLNPVVIHSEMNRSRRDAAFAALKSRRSRIVLCDNMLGEGFDFPQLKIAALHDLHKSLAITLQFTGRFTRTNEDR